MSFSAISEQYMSAVALKNISTSTYYNSHEKREEKTTHEEWG